MFGRLQLGRWPGYREAQHRCLEKSALAGELAGIAIGHKLMRALSNSCQATGLQQLCNNAMIV